MFKGLNPKFIDLNYRANLKRLLFFGAFSQSAYRGLNAML